MTPFPKQNFLNTEVFSRISLQAKAGFSESGSDSHQRMKPYALSFPTTTQTTWTFTISVF